jgi:hypothetical protein
MLFYDFFELSYYGVQGLIPCDPFPTVIPFFHGINDPIGMVGQLRDGQAFAAQGPVTDGGLSIPFYFNHLTVLDVGNDAAPPMATTADSPNLSYLSHG